MSGLFSAVADLAAARNARAALLVLMDTVGDSGLAVASAAPGLMAAVDQHAAAIRDSLFGDMRPLTEIALAGYAHGIREAAHDHGWRAPERPVDWTRADWVLTRLLGVCALADELAASRAA
jgi:Family of unknown function (DUF6401)